MGAPIDLVGQRFGKLTVTDLFSSGTGTRKWNCACDCGNTTVAEAGSLRYGHKRSCGCFQKERIAEIGTTHGMSNTPTYQGWAAMMSRCNYPANISYKNYGGRGIAVCERWKLFDNFFADMGEKPPGKSVERIDNDGNYEASNCRWATKEEQENNKRNSVKVTFNGRTLGYSQWARELGADPSVLRSRYIKFGTFEPQLRTRDSYLRKSQRNDHADAKS